MKHSTCEEQTFKRIFADNFLYLRNFLYYKSGDLELSRDLVQDAFMTLWNNCAKVSVSKAKSYLFTCANNAFLNLKKREKVGLNFQVDHNLGQENETPQYLMEVKEFKEKLFSTLETLDEDVRSIFLMNRIDKKKYREIAEELGISQKTVEKKMHKALARLRQIHKNV